MGHFDNTFTSWIFWWERWFEKLFWHIWQKYLAAPLWFFKCWFKLLLLHRFLRQIWHWKSKVIFSCLDFWWLNESKIRCRSFLKIIKMALPCQASNSCKAFATFWTFMGFPIGMRLKVTFQRSHLHWEMTNLALNFPLWPWNFGLVIFEPQMKYKAWAFGKCSITNQAIEGWNQAMSQRKMFL